MINYPKNPHFNRLAMRSPDYENWHEDMAHDPALLEWEGKYYAYSTDTFGAPSGYQIRVSDDLLHWDYAGTAFRLGTTSEEHEAAGLRAAYEWCVTRDREAAVGVCARKDGTMLLWAPHCVHGADGKFWLFYCLTGYFGGSKSCIGIAKASSPTGPFVGERILVQSPAGWRTPNAIDPQFFAAEGRAFLVYGSYGMGIHLIELDPRTGYRKDGKTYAEFEAGKLSLGQYYGVNLARGSVEGAAIRYHERVPVIVDGKTQYKNYYYLTCSYGSLSAVYQIRSGRSERPEGPYVDVNGNELICSTDLGTGNKLLASFRWTGDPVDTFCPGHNDLFTTADGINLVSYHARTNHFIETHRSNSNNFHYLYLGQYAFNSDGWLVMNANRYAGERIQPITAEELLAATGGEFEAVRLSQRTETITSKTVYLRPDGTIEGHYKGRWSMYGDNYIALEIEYDTYLGVVMPCWIRHRNCAGLTVAALGKRTGMSLHLNGVKQG